MYVWWSVACFHRWTLSSLAVLHSGQMVTDITYFLVACFHFNPRWLDAIVENVSVSCSVHLLNVWHMTMSVQDITVSVQGYISSRNWRLALKLGIHPHWTITGTIQSVKVIFIQLRVCTCIIKCGFSCSRYQSLSLCCTKIHAVSFYELRD